MLYNTSFNRVISEPITNETGSYRHLYIFSGTMPTEEEAKGVVRQSDGHVHYTDLAALAGTKGGSLIGRFLLVSNTNSINTELAKHITQLVPTGNDRELKPETLNQKATWFVLMAATNTEGYLSTQGLALFGTVGPLGSGADLEIGEDTIVSTSYLGNLSINFKPLSR